MNISETNSLFALSAIAVIAAIFMVPAGLVNADHAETDPNVLSKTHTCPDEIDDVAQEVTTSCSFRIQYNSLTSATILDTVPAEWEVTNEDAVEAEGCTVDPANKGKKADRSATKIVCEDTTSLDITVEISTRASPGKGHDPAVFKPTSCGDLSINDGAHAVDPETEEILFSTLPLTIQVNDPDDLDCDGLTNDEEADLGTNPEDPDSDGDDVIDGEDMCPLEGDMGNGVDEFGCPIP